MLLRAFVGSQILAIKGADRAVGGAQINADISFHDLFLAQGHGSRP